MISTAADLGRYLSMYLAEGLGPDGTRIVSRRRRPDPARRRDRTQSWAPGHREQGSRYAMGWFVGGPWGEDAALPPRQHARHHHHAQPLPRPGAWRVAVVVNAGNELPVPGNPFIADRVTRNVVHAALGQPVLDLPSMWRFYAVFDLVALLLLGAAALGAAAGRTGRPVPGPVPAPGRVAGQGSWSAPWAPACWSWCRRRATGGAACGPGRPDLAVVIAALALLLAAAAALRAIGLLRTRAPHPTCHLHHRRRT